MEGLTDHNSRKVVTPAIGLALSAVALVSALSGSAMAKSEKGFLSDAIKGDNSEIELGRLALSKSSDDDVKAFAQTLVDDHTKAKAQAAQSPRSSA